MDGMAEACARTRPQKPAAAKHFTWVADKADAQRRWGARRQRKIEFSAVGGGGAVGVLPACRRQAGDRAGGWALCYSCIASMHAYRRIQRHLPTL